jgi:hypothetical protein
VSFLNIGNINMAYVPFCWKPLLRFLAFEGRVIAPPIDISVKQKGAASLGLQVFRAFQSRILGFTRWQVISGKNSLDLGWGEGSRIFTKLSGSVRIPADPLVGHATASSKVIWICPSMHGFDWHHKTHAIGRRNLTTTPCPRERQSILRGYQGGVGCHQCFIPQVILVNLCQSISAQSRNIADDKWLNACVACLGQ